MRQALRTALPIAALVLAGALVASRLLHDPPAPQVVPAPQEPQAPTPAVLPPAPLAAAPPVDAAAPPPRPRPAGALLARPAPVVGVVGPWDSITPAPLRSWPTLASALEEARPRLAPCYDEETQARYGPRPFSAIGAPRPGTGAAVLILELEASSGGRMRVVDAPVESRGAAEDGLLSCVQEALRGLELKGPEGPGARFRVRYPLRPMAQGVASQQILAPRVRLKPH
jgi:hypothetical protein